MIAKHSLLLLGLLSASCVAQNLEDIFTQGKASGNPRPDSDEYNIDATYQPSKAFRLRTRLALIDYDSGSTEIYKNKAYDETNVRIITDYFFQ